MVKDMKKRDLNFSVLNQIIVYFLSFVGIGYFGQIIGEPASIKSIILTSRSKGEMK